MEKKGRLLGGSDDHLLFFDAGLLAGEIAEVEDAGPADLSYLVDLNAVDEGGLAGENPFHSDAAAHFADREGLGEGVGAFHLDDHASEFLKSFLIALFDSVGHGDGVAGLELGELCCLSVIESLLCNLN